jgi:hypothetical protein
MGPFPPSFGIIWFLVHISRGRLCFKMDRGKFQVKTMITKQ